MYKQCEKYANKFRNTRLKLYGIFDKSLIKNDLVVGGEEKCEKISFLYTIYLFLNFGLFEENWFF